MRPDQRRALGHKKVGTKYVTEEGSSGFPRWRIGIGLFRFRNMTLRYHITSEQGHQGAETRGKSTPDLESDEIYSLTKLSIFLSAFVFLLDFVSAYPSAFLSTGLPPFLAALRLVLSLHFISFFLFSLLFFFFFSY